MSGRRGVRQLTLFEVAIIIGLGSAAGDPMFQEDIPIFHAVVVFICVIAIYKTITWITSKSETVAQLLEGKVLLIVKDGVFDIKHENDNTFSRMEFFSELRNLNIEHLGQVREGVLEVDGTLSVLFIPMNKPNMGYHFFPHPTGLLILRRMKDHLHACIAEMSCLVSVLILHNVHDAKGQIGLRR
ncbi:DUF421 domain-containing protein [Sphingobacterium sp. E70]|uniref:DUF421 domain-containing protein n=1 Tax=Sphingobacterium sp. E70 TaxID=2853439 RepID=UPI00211B9746|nr:YetF domain-containing protein [Sphingobacterium sp. E70]ULT25232.1 DUF421 domain-containing protein [Sphingobacterium sp. E70]